MTCGKTSRLKHTLNCDRIEGWDEINGDVQLCLVWCETHRALEWHSLDLDRVETGGMFTTSKEPVSW